MSRDPEITNATAWPWRSSVQGESTFPDALLRGDAEEAARGLLGSLLISSVDGMRTAGVVVEAEAYTGPEDPASHARASVGRTDRNASMFGPPGRAYVYLSYGVHWCLNVVTGREGHPAAVLFRALDPLEGIDVMAQRRERPRDLCSGPGRLSQALGVTGALDGHGLRQAPLELRSGWSVGPEDIGTSSRIGVRRGRERLLRFYLKGHRSVSRPPRT